MGARLQVTGELVAVAAQAGQLLVGDQVPRRVRQGHVQAEEVGAREELVEQVGVFLGDDMAKFLVEAIVQLSDEATSWAAPVLPS